MVLSKGLMNGFLFIKIFDNFRMDTQMKIHHLFDQERTWQNHKRTVSCAQNSPDNGNQALFRTDQEQIANIQHFTRKRQEETNDHHDEYAFVFQFFQRFV